MGVAYLAWLLGTPGAFPKCFTASRALRGPILVTIATLINSNNKLPCNRIVFCPRGARKAN